MERRKAELAAKRAKLDELRKAREQREARTASGSLASSVSHTPARSLSTATEGRAGLDDLVSSLLGDTRDKEREEDVSGRVEGEGSVETDEVGRVGGAGSESMGPRTAGVSEGSSVAATAIMVSVSTSTSDDLYLAPPAPPKPKVVYDKSIQTSSDLYSLPSTSTSKGTTNDAAGGVGRENAEEMRARIIGELEEERRKVEEEISEENRRLAVEQESLLAKGLSAPEIDSLLASPPFMDFLSTSSKIVQRALSDSYDYLKDYTATREGLDSKDDGARVRLLGSWYDEKWGKGRSVTGVDWSPKFPELFAASYNKNPMAVNEPDGIACIWNLHLLERPEFVFHAQSDVLSVSFSPFHPNLLIGGTYSGQILLWDTRSRHPNPVLKSPLSATGHTHPVYSLSMIGTQNAHNLISASTDGTVCAWTLDLLARPQEVLGLVHPKHPKTDEVSITALGFAEGETTTFWVGTEEGNVYPANRYDGAGAKAGLVQSNVYKGHSGPVTSLDFHPQSGAVDLSDLFLTAGVDWTVKLWRAGAGAGAGGKESAGPVMSFEESDDYVYDVKWHPTHPALFGSVDGAGKFDLWDLNVDTEVPVVSTSVAPNAPRGLNKLAWDKREGKRAAIGSSDGKVYVYELSQDLVTPGEGAWDQMRKTCNSQSLP